MTTRALVFLESNTTGTGALFARAARAEGCEPILLAKEPDLYPFAAQEAVTVIEADTSSEASVLEVCREIAETIGLGGITSTSDYYVLAAAQLAVRFGLPGPSVTGLETCRDKERQYRCLAAAGVRVPNTQVAETSEQAEAAARCIGFPVVMKPVGGSGSVGVRLCTSRSEVQHHAARLLSQSVNERGIAVRRVILVQEFIDAPEFSVESIAGELVGITKKYVSGPPVFVETGHDFPASLSGADADALTKIVRSALAALDLQWGAAHTELRLTHRGPVIIEVNPRLAGGFIPELIRRAAGIDMIRQLTRRILGKPVRTRHECHDYASIRFIVPDRPGTLRAVTGQDRVRTVEEVRELNLYRHPGHHVVLSGDFHDRIGHVMTSCHDPLSARTSADRALTLLTVGLD